VALEVHHVPGRLRLKVAALRGNKTGAAELEQQLRAIDGVQEVRTSTTTGSIVIHYLPARASLGTVTATIKEMGWARYTGAVSEENAESLYINRSEPVATRVGEMFVNTLLEKAVERSAVALLGALI
jgi:hypothetical protein